jgi:hypothetical protein
MADRDDVTYRERTVAASTLRPRHCALLLGALLIALSGCSGSAPPPQQETANRGQVIDQDTGQPIPGVIVVARYVGSVAASGASSCNRVETAVSDENGWFELPLDPKAGPLLMEGYHKEYRHGYPVRVPTCLEGHPDQCQIWQDRRDDNDDVVSVVKEPKIYHGAEAAKEAARYRKDVYLKRFKGTREERLRELWRLQSGNSCLAPPKTSEGLVPFLEAILQEEIALGDSRDSIRDTNERIKWANEVLPGRR